MRSAPVSLLKIVISTPAYLWGNGFTYLQQSTCYTNKTEATSALYTKEIRVTIVC